MSFDGVMNKLFGLFGLHYIKKSSFNSLYDELCLKRQIVGGFDSLKGKGFPVYVDSDLLPIVKPRNGNRKTKVLIISIPKAGTYLISKLIEKTGWQDSELHIASEFTADYRGKSLKQKKSHSLDIFSYVSAPDISQMIQSGQFVVGHLPYSQNIKNAFSDYRKIFVYRDIKSAAVSYMRFVAKKQIPEYDNWTNLSEGPEKMLQFLNTAGQDFFDMAIPMSGWVSDQDILPVSFERLMGDSGNSVKVKEIKKILEFIGLDEEISVDDEMMQDVFGSDTVTWSGERSQIDIYWNDDVECKFEELGGNSLNSKLYA